MRRISVHRRRRSVRRLALEGLETRQLLSGSPGSLDPPAGAPAFYGPAALAGPLPDSPAASLIQTDPADGAVLSSPVTSLAVTFPDQVDFLWGGLPIQLLKIAPDGSSTPVLDPNQPPWPEFDDSGSVATFALGHELAPGHYRVVLTAMSDVSFFLSDGLWDFADDQTLADFTVLSKAPTFNDAVDLGPIGPNVQAVTGSFDHSAGYGYAQLYKITLTPGHFWRLGVQLDASRIGSSFQGALALFDGSGTLLATRDAGSGRPDFPSDPYLFKGLAPGVYYLGVSGAGDLPDIPGGYDPNGAIAGRIGLDQPGGAYQLQVVADPADRPTAVTGFRLDWADTLGAGPSGLTLSFSGPIDPTSIVAADGKTATVVAVDQSGRAWSLTPSHYDESSGQLSLVFNQALPAGRYTLRLADGGGLADLAGLTPVAPGLPAGSLASWTVSASTESQAAGNLGVLWPSLTSGLSSSVTVSPGGASVLRVVIPLPGWYVMQSDGLTPDLTVTRVGTDGDASLVTGGGQARVPLYLYPGVHLFVLSNRGDVPATVRWILRPLDVSPESLLNNGVGNSPALALRLVNPLAVVAGSAPSTGPLTVAPSGGDTAAPLLSVGPVGTGVVLMAEQVGHAGTAASPVPSNLLVSVNTGLLGRPSSQPGDTTTAPALLGTPVIQPTDPSSPATGTVMAWLDGEVAAPREAVRPDAPATDPDLAALPDEAQAPRAETSARADALALAQANRITGLADRLQRWLGGRAADAGATAPEHGDELLASLLEDDSLRPPLDELELADSGQDRIERAELGVPLSVLVAAAAAYRLRQLTGRWWRRTPTVVRGTSSHAGSRRAWNRPHLDRLRPRAGARRPVSR